MVGAVDQAFILNHIHDRQRSCTADWRAGIGSAKPAWKRRIHDFGLADHCRDRIPACHAFGYGHQIGLNAGVLHTEEPPGPCETGLYLIGDHYDAVLVANFAQRMQELIRR